MNGEQSTFEVDIVITGRGGQGTKLAAQLLAAAAALDGDFPLHYSVYGALIRGGDIASTVVIGSAPPQCALRDSFQLMAAAHNNWFDRYYALIQPGGALIYDPANIGATRLGRSDVSHMPIDLGSIAAETGDPRAKNMVLAGACARILARPSLKSLLSGITTVVPAHRQDRISRNRAAVQRGWEWEAARVDAGVGSYGDH